MTELAKYEKMLKDNKANIKRLLDANKHIEAHIKFLKGTGEEVEDKTEDARSEWDAPESEQ